MTSEKTIYSHHVFLFPFRWDYLNNNQNSEKLSFKDRLNREKFINLLDNRWTDSEYYFKDPLQYYNSANYFYEFARKAIYSTDGDNSTVINKRFNFKGRVYSYFIERLLSDDSTKIYSLRVQHIGLNIYESGIGILSFHLINEFESQKLPEDILAINDFGRRMYPQFLDTGTFDSNGNPIENIIERTQKAFLAKSIRIATDLNEKTEGYNCIFQEKFEDYYNRDILISRIKNSPSNLPNTPKSIASFLGKEIGTTDITDTNYLALIRPILDDRNMVLCWYGNDAEINKLQWDESESKYGYRNNQNLNFWLQYIFIDNSGNTIQNKEVQEKSALKHTYARWVDSGTLYGLTRYSLVCLTATGWWPENILRKQIGGGVYFELAQLILAQRASVIRFSDEATLLASKKISISDAQFLHEQYMRFVNKLYFREATAQEQGIEMYNQLCDFMEINRDVDNLNREIDELHQFVSMEEQENQTKQATNLTKVATILLPATLLTGVLGMNTIDTNILPEFLISCKPQWPFFLSIGLVFILSIAFIWGLNSLFQLDISFKNKKS